MCAQSVVSHGFGSEWHIRFSKTEILIPGYTDMVSTATSGLLDRSRYFFSRGCSLSYRLSFITSLVLVVLAGLSPGSINVEDIQQFEHSTISITNFTAIGGDVNNVLGTPIFRAGLIADLELRENTTFKFTTEEHVIVGWPNIDRHRRSTCLSGTQRGMQADSRGIPGQHPSLTQNLMEVGGHTSSKNTSSLTSNTF